MKTILALILGMGSAFSFVHIWTVAVEIWALHNVQTVLQHARTFNALFGLAILILCEFYAVVWVGLKTEKIKEESC